MHIYGIKKVFFILVLFAISACSVEYDIVDETPNESYIYKFNKPSDIDYTSVESYTFAWEDYDLPDAPDGFEKYVVYVFSGENCQGDPVSARFQAKNYHVVNEFIIDGQTFSVGVALRRENDALGPLVCSPSVHADKTIPTVSVTTAESFPSHSTSFQISGSCSDDKSIKADGAIRICTKVSCSQPEDFNDAVANCSNGTYLANITPPEGHIDVKVISYDQGGNRSLSQILPVAIDRTPPSALTFTSHISSTLIGANQFNFSWVAVDDGVAGLSTTQPYDIRLFDNGTCSGTELLVGSPATNQYLATSLGDGQTYSIGVRARDEAGNISSEFCSESITVSFQAPILALSDMTNTLVPYQETFAKTQNVTAAISNDPSAVAWCLSETQSSQPSSATCSGTGWLGTRPTGFTLSAGDGAKVVYLWVRDSLGTVLSLGTSDTITLDRVNPAPLSIASPAANTEAQTGVTLSGSCENGLTVNLSGAGLASPSTTPCAGGTFSQAITFTAGDGSKTIAIGQTDNASNSSSISRSFIRDSTAPILAFTSPAVNAEAQTGVTIAGTCEAGLIVNISGVGHASPATTSCAAGTFSQAITFTVGEGTKNIVVSQTDPAGNVGNTNRDFVRDNAPPVLTFTSPASNTEAQTGVTIAGTCEAGLIVNISGAGHTSPATTSCAAGTFSEVITFTAGEGTKNIVVSQTDPAGNVGSTNRDFVRDNTPPVLAFTSPAVNTEAQTGVTIAGSCEAGLAVNISGAGHASPATTSCAAGTFSEAITFSAGEGTKNIVVSQTDPAGNVGSANRNFIRDNTAPVLAFTSPAANTEAQTGVTITGTCEAGLTVNISGAGHVSPGTTSCAAGTFSEAITFTVGEGTKNIVVSQTDPAGNVGSANRDFVRDNTAPVLTFTSPAANTEAQTGVTITGSCEAGLAVNISGAGHASPATTSCAAGTFSEVITFTAGEGVKNIVISQTDPAGNAGSTHRNFVRDNTNPVIAFTGPAANTEAQAGVTITGSCETGLTVNISGTGHASPATTACLAASFSETIVFTVSEGTKNIVVSQTDPAGNVGSANRNFIKDVTPPPLTNTSPADGTEAQGSVTLTGACEDGLDIDYAGTGILSPFSVACSGGTYSQTVFFSAGDGSKAISIAQTDPAGNNATINKTFVRDETAPVITQLTLTSPHYSNSDDVTFGGACEDGLTVTVELNAVFENTTACSGGSWTYTVATQTTDATRTYSFAQTDPAGNTGTASVQWIRDTLNPTLTFTSSSSQNTSTDDVTFSGTCETGLGNIVITGQDSTSTTCGGGTWSYTVATQTTDATYNYTFTLTDQAGNLTQINGDWTRDTTGPALTINEAAPIINTVNDATFTGTCTDGISIVISGTDSGSTVCSGGNWSYTVSTQSTDASRGYQFEQTDALLNTTTVSGTWIRDTTAPVLQAGFFDLDEGTSPIGKTFVSLDLRAIDALTNVTHFCIKSYDTTQPAVSDSCWVAVNAPSPGLIPDPTLDLNDYTYVLGVTPGTYNVYAWAKDEADNISTLTNSGSGTTAQDFASVVYLNDVSPAIDFVIATNTDSPSNPPTIAELTASSGSDVFIKWKVSDDTPLPANPISLYFTTDEVNYTLIASDIANAQGADCTSDDAGSSFDDGGTGCYKWVSPLSTYFRIRLVAKDIVDQEAVSTSSPINGSQFRILGGNTDPGIGGAGELVSVDPYMTTSSLHTPARRSFVITDTSDVYIQDRNKGVLKINGLTGVVSEYLRETGTYSGDNVAVSTATAREIYQIALDYSNNLWVFDYNRIRKIDLSTDTITTVIGGGSNISDTIADPLDLQIRHQYNSTHMNYATFEILPNGHLYFESEYFYVVNQGQRKVRVYKPEETNKIQTLEFNGTESHRGTHSGGMDDCNLQRFAMEFDLSTSTINYFIGNMFFRPSWPTTNCPEDSYTSAFGDEYYVATFDPVTYQSRVGGNHFSSIGGDNPQQHHFTGMDGRLYVLRRDIGRIYQADDSTGNLDHIFGDGYGVDCADGTPVLSCAMNIQDVFVTSTGKIYVMDDARIRTADNSGNIVTLYGQNRIFGDGGHPLYARFGKITDVFVGNDGRVVIGDLDNRRMREIDTTGQSISHLAGNGLNSVDTSLLATQTGLYNGWGLATYMEPTSNDLYKRESVSGAGTAITKLNRSTGQWEVILGAGATFPWDPGGDGSIGADINFHSVHQQRPLGFANGQLIAMTGFYGWELGALIYRYQQIKLFDSTDSYRQSHLVGDSSATHASPWHMCAAGTSVNSCLPFIGQPSVSAFVHYDSVDDKYITLSRRTSSRVVEINPGATVEDFETLPRGAHSMTYRRDGATEWLYYCDSVGELYKYEVGVGETSLPLPSSSIKCTGDTLVYDSVNDRLVFPFEQNGLYGVGEFTNP